ncbi:MAG: hypothetical protein MK165_04425 [Pirellulaceae bacterium]|nr:hypothetical protein [Pirellulaceae bacterium]
MFAIGICGFLLGIVAASALQAYSRLCERQEKEMDRGAAAFAKQQERVRQIVKDVQIQPGKYAVIFEKVDPDFNDSPTRIYLYDCFDHVAAALTLDEVEDRVWVLDSNRDLIADNRADHWFPYDARDLVRWKQRPTLINESMLAAHAVESIMVETAAVNRNATEYSS